MSATVALLVASLVAQPQDPRALPPPPTPVPSAPTAGPTDGPNTVRVAGGLAYRLSGEAPSVDAAGLSVAATFEHRYATVDFLELGAALNVLVERFSESAIDMDGNPTTLALIRSNFIAMQTAAVRTERLRFWAGIGAGVVLAQELSSSDTQFVVAHASLGGELTLQGRSALALLGGYTRPFKTPSSTDHSFGDVDLAYVYRF